MALRGAEGGAGKRSAMPAPKAREGGADPSTFTCTLKVYVKRIRIRIRKGASARTVKGGARPVTKKRGRALNWRSSPSSTSLKHIKRKSGAKA